GMHNIEGCDLRKQIAAHEEVIQYLRVAVEDVGILLVYGQRRNQVGQHTTRHRLYRRREWEIVEVAEHDEIGIGINRQNAVDELVDHLCLLQPLRFRLQYGRLHSSEQRTVATLRVEVVDDDDHL